MDFLLNLLHKYKTYIKFGISGFTATAVDLLFLYLFHGVLAIHLLVASSMAFIIAFLVSFYLQKFWTFRNDDTTKMPQQLSIYFFVGTTNLLLNALIIHTAVRKFGVFYLIAQVLSTMILSAWSFMMNKFVIFKKIQREKKLKKKFGERIKQRFFVLINADDLDKFKPAEDCEYRGIILGNKDNSTTTHDFTIINKSKVKFVNFIKILYQTRKWIYWSDKVKCFCLGELALPGYIVAKLADKKFILQTKNDKKPKGWQQKIIREVDEVIIS